MIILLPTDLNDIALSAFRFYVNKGLDVSLDYSSCAKYYLLEVLLPKGQELPVYPLLENSSIAYVNSDIDPYTTSYLFSIICH